MPTTPNGKVDRKALPAPDIGNREREIIAAGSTAEAEITEVWQSLLGDDRIGVTETFFDVGGNSLLLIRLAHLLTGRFQKPVSVQELLRHTTIRQQAELIAAETTDTDEAVAAAAEGVAARRGRRSARRRRMET